MNQFLEDAMNATHCIRFRNSGPISRPPQDTSLLIGFVSS